MSYQFEVGAPSTNLFEGMQLTKLGLGFALEPAEAEPTIVPSI